MNNIIIILISVSLIYYLTKPKYSQNLKLEEAKKRCAADPIFYTHDWRVEDNSFHCQNCGLLIKIANIKENK